MTKTFSFLLLSLVLLGAGCAQQKETTPQDVEAEPQTKTEVVVFADGSYTLDVSSSSLYWEASKVKMTHNGSVEAQEGSARVEQGQVAEGQVIVDMTTIKNFDQEGNFLETLENHLRSEDFFDVNVYPSATFTVSELEPLAGLNGFNFRLDGHLKMKEIEQPVSFPVLIEQTEQGLRLLGRMTVDRTQYDIRFGSGKFFENLGDGLIDDEFYVDLDLFFVPEQE